MMKNMIVSMIFCLGAFSLHGQKNVRVSSTPAIENLMNRFIAEGKSEETIKGWRIQIVTTNDRREMETAQSTFSSLYPEISVDWKHVTPYYQVKVGYFENKNKLMPFLLELKKTFPAATFVYDQVAKRSVVN
jgi:hypothetical protein